jgi:hypothetical protein
MGSSTRIPAIWAASTATACRLFFGAQNSCCCSQLPPFRQGRAKSKVSVTCVSSCGQLSRVTSRFRFAGGPPETMSSTDQMSIHTVLSSVPGAQAPARKCKKKPSPIFVNVFFFGVVAWSDSSDLISPLLLLFTSEVDTWLDESSVGCVPASEDAVGWEPWWMVWCKRLELEQARTLE